MALHSEIPTSPSQPFSQTTDIQGVVYTLKFRWNHISKSWTMDIYTEDEAGKWICGIPLVTGCDLLEQFAYLPMGRNTMLTVMTVGPGVSPNTVPNFENLGIDGHLYMTTPSPTSTP